MPVDVNVVNELKEIMEDEFDELISLFISDTQIQIENLKKAVNSSNNEEIRKIAHALKGSCVNIGVFKLSESFKILEYSASENSLANVNELLKKIITDFFETKKFFDENF